MSNGDTIELTRVGPRSDGEQSPQHAADDAFEDEVASPCETSQDEHNGPHLSRKTKLSRKLKRLIVGQADDSEDKVELKKELTVLSGVAFITGNIIGSGIFITPKKILTNTGSFGLTLVVWIIGAIIALLGSLCYIELGVVIRKSGGEYPLILTAYSFKKRNKWVELLGQVLAFLFSWTSVFIIRSIGASIILLTCARYLVRPFYIDCEAPRAVVTVLALSILILAGTIVSVSVKFTARVITVLSALKVLALVFVALVGIIHIIINGCFPSDVQYPFQPQEGYEPTVSSIAIALYGVAFAYDGWNVMNYAIEETKNVEKTLPRSLFIGVPIVAICYLLVNVAYFGVLSYDQILSTDAVALTFGSTALGKAGLVVIPLMVALSTGGASLSSVYTASRLIFAAARDGMLPEALSGLHKTKKTPVPAIVLQVLMCAIGILIGDISSLLDGYSAVAFLFYGLVFAGVLIMRVTHKEEPRPFRAWFIVPVAILAILISVFLVVFPLIQEPVPCVIAFAVTLLGLPVYPFLVMEKPWRLRPKFMDRISKHVTEFTNNLLNTETTYGNKAREEALDK